MTKQLTFAEDCAANLYDQLEYNMLKLYDQRVDLGGGWLTRNMRRIFALTNSKSWIVFEVLPVQALFRSRMPLYLFLTFTLFFLFLCAKNILDILQLGNCSA